MGRRGFHQSRRKQNTLELSKIKEIDTKIKKSQTNRAQSGGHSDEKRKCSNKKGTVYSMEKDKSATKNIFPHWLPWILFPLTLSLRIIYVLEPTNRWILHPDEIFQTIEVAHSDRFRYGFRPYEYLPPPGNDVSGASGLSSARAQEIQFGMYSLRSFILPKVLSAVMLLGSICDISPYLVIKIFHVVVTSFLPVAVFRFSMKLHNSRDTGCLAAVLVSSSLCLNVFGTHTTINSFLSPCLFLSLIPLVNLLKSDERADILALERNEHVSPGSSKQSSLELEVKGHKEEQQINSTFSSHDENANIIVLEQKITNLGPLTKCEVKICEGTSDVSTEVTNDTNLVFSQHVRSLNQFNTYELFSGVCLALCIYLRADLMFIPLLLVASFYNHIYHKIANFVSSCYYYFLGFLTGYLIGGYCDYVTYGSWFLSPYQWYKFNVRNSFAGGIFGVNAWNFYLIKLYEAEPLVILSFTIVLSDVFIGTTLNLRRNTSTVNIRSHLANNQSLATVIFLLLAFTLNGHKELRFIHNGIVLMYIATARAIFSIHINIKRLAYNQNKSQYFIYAVYIFIVLFVSSHYYYFQNMKIEDRAKWTYAKTVDSHETNICLDFIRQQNNVSGVFMDRSLQMSGSYSVLHHDAPIFALNMFEFIEYRPLHSNAADVRSMGGEAYSTFTDISDFISIHNAQYLMRTLITKPEYNYIILRTYENFINVGYEEVFRVGKSKVLKRGNDEKTQTDLKTVAENFQVHWNATILEYEGDWLKRYGLYEKAEERLIMANRVDPKRIGTFKILLDMYRKMNSREKYKSVLTACLQLYKKSECLKPYIPVILHRGYYRKIIK